MISSTGSHDPRPLRGVDRDEGQAAGHPDDVNAGDKIPDAQHPVGNAIQHTARTYGLGEPTGLGLGDQTPTVIPDHEFRVYHLGQWVTGGMRIHIPVGVAANPPPAVSL